MDAYFEDIRSAGAITYGLTVAPSIWRVMDNGLTPSTSDLNGGVQIITCYGTGSLTTLEDQFVALQNVLRTAASDYANGINSWYLVVHQSTVTDSAFTYRRARVKGGEARKTKWRARDDTAADIYYIEIQVTVEHEAIELTERVTLKNLVINPSFEYDTNGDGTPNNWTAAGAATITVDASATAPHGRYVVGVDNVVNYNNDYLQSDSITVTIGAVYELIGYMVPAQVVARIAVHRSDTGAVLAHMHPSGGGGSWERCRTTFTAPTATCYIRLTDEGNTGGKFSFDAVYLGLRNTYLGSDWDHGMWSDYYTIDDHDDWEWEEANGRLWAAGAHQNSIHRETIDILQIPGDIPPYIQVLDNIGYDWSSSRIGALSVPHASRTWLSYQAESATQHMGFHTTSTIAGASGPAANNCEALLMAPSGAANWYQLWTITEDDALRLAGKLVRAIAILGNVAAPGASYVIKWGLSKTTLLGPSEYYEATMPNSAGVAWQVCPGPTFRFPLRVPSRPSEYAVDGEQITFWGSQAAGTDCYLDRLILVPLDGYVEGPDLMFTGAAGALYRLTDDDRMFSLRNSTGELVDYYQCAGSLCRFEPEDEVRLWFHNTDTQAWAQAIVTIYVRPRYSSF